MMFNSKPTGKSGIVDLTESESTISVSGNPRSMEHLSRAGNPPVVYTEQEVTQRQHHMHKVVALLRPAPPSIDLTMDDESDQDVSSTMSPSTYRQKLVRLHLQNVKHEISSILKSRESGERSSSSRSYLTNSSPFKQLDSTLVGRLGEASGKKTFKPFPFMDFPPEIRNTVYKILLTTPNAPIEFPGLTGQNAARHRAQWAKCTTTKMRRRHKKLFPEILEVCRQVHDEASGIIYGCNIFKYRSNPAEGRKSVVLPTRHLHLLKHIKISVVSRQAQNGQSEWVADLIKQFGKDDLRLETFELTWYGWSRLSLRVDGLVGQALHLLQVSRTFVIKITGEARMEKAMQEQLERSLTSRKVEIQRPVKAATGEDLSESESS